MTREQAAEIEAFLREYYNDRTGEITMEEIIVDGEDVSHLYDKLFSIEYLDKIPDLKISRPILPNIAKEQAINLIMEIYETYKKDHKSPFVNKEWKD